MTNWQLISWNVNGIRAVARKGFLEWLAKKQPDILAIQETKAHPDQLSVPLLQPPGYRSFWVSAQRKGYSGVALYIKEKILPQKIIKIPKNTIAFFIKIHTRRISEMFSIN